MIKASGLARCWAAAEGGVGSVRGWDVGVKELGALLTSPGHWLLGRERESLARPLHGSWALGEHGPEGRACLSLKRSRGLGPCYRELSHFRTHVEF